MYVIKEFQLELIFSSCVHEQKKPELASKLLQVECRLSPRQPGKIQTEHQNEEES